MKIACVDDDRTLLAFLEGQFRDRGFEVITTDKSVHALSLVLRTRPDLILLDLDMPILDGLKVLDQLRTHPHTSTIPVIMLSAYGTKHAVLKALALGISDYVVKTDDFDRILNKVCQVLGLDPEGLEARGEGAVLAEAAMEGGLAAPTTTEPLHWRSSRAEVEEGQGAVEVVTLRGRWQEGEFKQLLEALEALVEQQVHRLVIEVSDVAGIQQGEMNQMADELRHLKGRGAQLKIACRDGCTADEIRRSRLWTLLPCFKTVRAALDAFG